MADEQPGPSEARLHVMAELWWLSLPGPDNLLAAPAFVRLREACRDGYANAGKAEPAFALSTVLRSLGLPCEICADAAHLASPVEAAMIKLDTAFRATHARHIHLAPLDLAEEIPALAFGPASVARFTADELLALVPACSPRAQLLKQHALHHRVDRTDIPVRGGNFHREDGCKHVLHSNRQSNHCRNE